MSCVHLQFKGSRPCAACSQSARVAGLRSLPTPARLTLESLTGQASILSREMGAVFGALVMLERPLTEAQVTLITKLLVVMQEHCETLRTMTDATMLLKAAIQTPEKIAEIMPRVVEQIPGKH